MKKDIPTSEIEELQKKLQENPESMAFAPLAEAFRKEGKLDEALRVCESGLRKHPSYTSARVVLGRIYQEQGKEDQAISELGKVLELDAENIAAYSLLGSMHMAARDYQAAIGEYQKILSLNPDDETAQNSLREAIEKVAGNRETVKPLPKDIPSIEPKPPAKETTATLTIAELYLNQGHTDKSIEVFQELLAHDPQNLILRQKLSEVIERQMREAAVGKTARIKPSEFTRPPDPKEDSLAEQSGKEAPAGSGRKKEDSKFTNDEIHQVMGGGETAAAPSPEKGPMEEKKSVAIPPRVISPISEGEEGSNPLGKESLEELKRVLIGLCALDGVLRSLLVNKGGILVVSMGETSNNEVLGRQALEIFRGVDHSVSGLKQGKLQQISVAAEGVSVLLVSTGSFVLVVVADNKANLGILRLGLEVATRNIAKVR